MAQLIDDSFDQLVPNAARRARQFLGVVQQRSQEEPGLVELPLAPARPSRKSDRIVLAASIQIGNMWRKGRPVSLQVYADPIGNHLQVGYQVTRDVASGIMASTHFGQHVGFSLDRMDNHPDTIRKINGLLSVFKYTVFVPVLEQLVAATERGVASQGQGGFFGTQ